MTQETPEHRPENGNAIIGLGSMGLAMAGNIIQAGLPLAGYDLAPKSRARFAELGGIPADTPSSCVRGCNLLLLMVVNAQQIEAILFDEGVADALEPGSVIMCCSTIAPSEARSLDAKLQPYGHHWLDAPVSGGRAGAETGTLTIMASGAAKAFERAKAVLEALSGRIHYVGAKAGIGTSYKIVHQLAAGVHLVAAAELMALGEKAGCDPHKLFTIVSESAGQSWMFNDRVPQMLNGDFTPRSMVDIFVKDLGLVLQTGQECQAPLPLAAAAHQMLLAASGMGYGAYDDSVLVKVYQALCQPAAAPRDSDCPDQG